MAKKFATILGFSSLYDTITIDANKNLKGYDLSKINPNASEEIKQNIDENTIVFITADQDDNDKLVGARKYQIKSGDRFIIAQKDIYSLFDARKIAGPTGPGAVFSFFDFPPSDAEFTDMGDETLDGLNLQKGDYGISQEGKIWVYNGSKMTDTTINLKGPTGSPGQNGADGTNGQNGSGSVVDLMGFENTQYETIPTGSLIEGDYGISKEGDVWVFDGNALQKSDINLKGPKGDNGAEGPQGPAGGTTGGTGGTTEIIKDSLPIGAITMYAGEQSSLPYGWLLCDGAEYKIKSVSTINIPGHGPADDGETLFTTVFKGNTIKWQIADKRLDYICDLLKIIKDKYGMNDAPTSYPY